MIPSSRSSRSSNLLPLLFKFCALALFLEGMAVSSRAQDKVELFGGYSYFRASIEEGRFVPVIVTRVSEKGNLNGWEFSAQYKFLPFLGGVADFNGNYGTLHSAGTREHTFLFGPQVSLPTRVSPFAHALFGIAKESQDTIPTPCPITVPGCSGFFTLGSDTSFATAVGAGIDVKLVPFVKVRLIQIDYVRTQLHGATQNQPRASAGIVFHF